MEDTLIGGGGKAKVSETGVSYGSDVLSDSRETLREGTGSVIGCSTFSIAGRMSATGAGGPGSWDDIKRGASVASIRDDEGVGIGFDFGTSETES